MSKLFVITSFRCVDSERMMDCIGEGEFFVNKSSTRKYELDFSTLIQTAINTRIRV